jgi:hypothetical protein
MDPSVVTDLKFHVLERDPKVDRVSPRLACHGSPKRTAITVARRAWRHLHRISTHGTVS